MARLLRNGGTTSIACRMSLDGRPTGCAVLVNTDADLTNVVMAGLLRPALRYNPMTSNGVPVIGTHIFTVGIAPAGRTPSPCTYSCRN